MENNVGDKTSSCLPCKLASQFCTDFYKSILLDIIV